MNNTNIYLAVVELTNRCNLRCKHCYGLFTGNKSLSRILLLKIINELKKVNCKIVNLSGGEPLLLGSKIFEYALLVKKYLNARVQLTTNGTLVDDFSNIERFMIFDNVQISLDGDEKTHDEIRGVGSYRQSVKNLLLLKENNIRVSVMMTIHRKNLRKLTEVLAFTQKIGVKLAIERFTPVGRGNRFTNDLSRRAWKQALSLAVKMGVDTSDPLKFYFLPNIKNYFLKNWVIVGCSAGLNAVCIDVDLNVFPCPRLRINCGNLYLESLPAIVEGKIMSDLGGRTNLKGKCGSCKNQMICGGCRAYALAKYNDVLAEDPLCFSEINV